MNFFKKLFFLSLFLVSIPGFSLAAGSATFTYPPAVTFQTNGSLVQVITEGSITLQSATEDDFFLGVKTFIGNTPPTQEQIDNPEGLNFISTSLGGTVFNSSANLSPGTSYYFIFKIVPNGENITGDIEVVAVNTPGSSSGVTQDPPCEGCAIDTSDSSGSYVGWPQDVIDNPLAVSDLNSFIVGLLNALLKIGIPVLTIFLVYSGLRLVMARGNEKELEDAKENLLWVIIGGAILLGSWTIVRILKGTFDEIDLALINSLVNNIV